MFTWKILGITDQCTSVQYLIVATDDKNSVETQGNHVFSDGVVNKPFEQIVESDILQWLQKDLTQEVIDAIKLNLENQLKTIESSKKVDFPWLAGTFTIE